MKGTVSLKLKMRNIQIWNRDRNWKIFRLRFFAIYCTKSIGYLIQILNFRLLKVISIYGINVSKYEVKLPKLGLLTPLLYIVQVPGTLMYICIIYLVHQRRLSGVYTYSDIYISDVISLKSINAPPKLGPRPTPLIPHIQGPILNRQSHKINGMLGTATNSTNAVLCALCYKKKASTVHIYVSCKAFQF